MFFFFKQKTAYEMRISDWSSDVCSSDLQYVQAAEFLDRSGHCSLDLCFIGDVAGDADCGAPGIDNLFHHAVDIRLSVGRHRDFRALPGEEFRDRATDAPTSRSEEHTSELQSLMRISYAVFCLKKKKQQIQN